MPRLLEANIRLRPLGVGETGPLGLYVGGGIACPDGSPDVLLEMGEAFAYYGTTPKTYVGVMGINVQSLSATCFTYFTWEMKMWAGIPSTTCPTSPPEKQEISRFFGRVAPTKTISISRLMAAETKMIGGSFEIPPTMEGEKTICLSLWGNYDKDVLKAELLTDGGYEFEMPW